MKENKKHRNKKSLILVLALAGLLLPSCSNASASSSGTSIDTSSEAPSSEESSSSDSSMGTSSSDPSSSPSSGSSSSTPDPDPEPGPISLSGVGDTSIVAGDYFDVFKGVGASTEGGLDLTHKIRVAGNVNYAVPGNYGITYSVEHEGYEAKEDRVISVTSGSLPASGTFERSYGEDKKVSIGSGSYRQGGESPTVLQPYEDESGGYAERVVDLSRPGSPAYMDAEYFNEGPVETNGWYTGFFHSDFGGATSAASYPLITKLGGTNGVSISSRGDGFTQYFNVNDTFGTSSKTMENFTSTFDDIFVKTPSLSSNLRSSVLSGDRFSTRFSLMDDATREDEMVVTLTTGSPYAFFEANDTRATLNLKQAGVTAPYKFYDVNGNVIDTTSSYSGDSLVICFPSAHYGYEVNYDSGALGAALYWEQLFLVKAPKGSTFAFSQGSHPSTDYMAEVSIDLNGNNWFSLGSIENLSDAASLASTGDLFLQGGRSVYEVDHSSGIVEDTIYYNVHEMEGEEGEEPYIGLLPHQWKNTEDPLSELYITTMRGKLKLMKVSSFSTRLSFSGLLPGLPVPNVSTYERSTMVEYLDSLISLNQPTGEWLGEEGKNFIDATGPYWNAKAIYPLSIGLFIADQIGADTQKASIMALLKEDLIDWFTYDGADDLRYLYYDEVYGTIYYSNNDFSTASRLSDHHFTAGYFVYASAILSLFDKDFLDGYKDIVSLLLKDYMNYDRNSDMFPYLRGFDEYAGHSWADGVGDFGDGNDQESSGEALNSWTAGYLFSLVTGDQKGVDAAIYGYTSELEAVKQYWFNYDEDNWNASLATHAHAIGILWGAKNSHATWFGSNPEFIYGIHWLPTGEYLTGYALSEKEKAVLQGIYEEMESHIGGGKPRTWFSNMWPMKALYDPTGAMNEFDATKILADDYPSELAGSYYLANALSSFGSKDGTGFVSTDQGVAGSVYTKNGVRTAIIYNPTSDSKTVSVTVGENNRSVSAEAGFTVVSL